MLLTFGIMKHPILNVTDAKGKVLAVQVPIEDRNALLELVCALQERLRPQTQLDSQLSKLVRKRTGKKKNVDLDDIGFVGTGRVITEEESMLMSARVQANKAERSVKERRGAVVLGKRI